MATTVGRGTAAFPAPPRTAAGDTDRFGLALFFAVGLHALLILGVTFDLEKLKPSEPRPLSLEITLVHSKSEKAPEEADYLAQEDQVGGGGVRERVRPSSPFPNPRPTPEQGDARNAREAASPPPQPEQTRILTGERSATRIQSAPEAPRPQQQELPSAAELVARSREIARLSAEIRERQQAYAQMPRHRYISANTKRYTHAAYEDAWRIKVERIGNLNYPEEAKRRGLTGNLMLDVGINPDGSLHSIRVVHSSGQKVLDDAARRIVEMAAPFAPFTDELRREMDVMHIVRVWEFQSGNQLSTQR